MACCPGANWADAKTFAKVFQELDKAERRGLFERFAAQGRVDMREGLALAALAGAAIYPLPSEECTGPSRMWDNVAGVACLYYVFDVPYELCYKEQVDLIVLVIELSDRARTLPKFRFHPATLFIFSFLFLILSGTGLLMLPEMTTDGLGMDFFDALFTSTSATCVTGLMIENAETFFSHKGHVVLMVLIKLGGLNIIAFGSLIAVLARFGVGVRQHDVIEDCVNRGTILGTRGMLGRVIIWSIGIEVLPWRNTRAVMGILIDRKRRSLPDGAVGAGVGGGVGGWVGGGGGVVMLFL